MAKEPGKLKMKLAYAAGDIYGGGAFLIFSMLYMNYLVLVEGLPVVATSLIVFIGKLWDAITDPIMGRISDRTRSRFGRRRLYFLIGIIPVFASFVMMFYSFGMVSTLSKIIYYTFAYMFFGTAFTIVMVPYNAILSDM
ncbi:MAG: MFS transporter, partial [Clostridiaceae bacterium]